MESVFRLTVWFKKAQAFSILDSFFFFNWASLDLDWDSWFFIRWVQGLTLTISNKITEPFHWASMLWKLFARPESLSVPDYRTGLFSSPDTLTLQGALRLFLHNPLPIPLNWKIFVFPWFHWLCHPRIRVDNTSNFILQHACTCPVWLNKYKCYYC